MMMMMMSISSGNVSIIDDGVVAAFLRLLEFVDLTLIVFGDVASKPTALTRQTDRT